MTELDLLQQAIALTEQCKFDEAKNIYLKLIEQYPDDAVYLSAFGLFFIGQRDFESASVYIQKAYNLKKTFGTVSALGLAEYECGNYNKAAEILQEALEYGENEDIYSKCIASLFAIKFYSKAIYYADKMYALYPNSIKAISNKIKALMNSGKLIEAERLCVDRLKNNTNIGILWFNLGILKELIYSDEKQAIECYKLAEQNGAQGSDYNIAVAYYKMGKYDKAEEYYKKFLDKFPNHKAAISALGMLYLEQKKFEEGYALYYQRNGSIEKRTTQNLWKPKTPLDNELVIISDQGFGDDILFIRYLPFLSNHKIKVFVPKRIINLFRQNYPDTEFINIDEINPKTQAIRICDLPFALNMDFNNIPYAEGYLNADAMNIENSKLKVGLCWEAGSTAIRNMINRTINVRCFEPIFNIDNIQVYSFQVKDSQKGNEKYAHKMINLAKEFCDFTDTAKALKAMDVVVTVDTSVAHLAGAMGIKTFLLLPYAPDWRWFNAKERTPWYNSIQIFRQTDHISWEEQINTIGEQLSHINID